MAGGAARVGWVIGAVGAMVAATAACGGARDHVDELSNKGNAGAHGNPTGGAVGAGGAGGGAAGSGAGGMCQPPSAACSIPGCSAVGPLPGGSDLTGVWISPTGEVWVVAEGGFVGRRHYGTGAWCFCAPKPPYSLRAIWGASDTELFAAGDNGTLLRYDGTRWLYYLASAVDLTAIHGTAANDVWAVGDNGAAVHFDGTTWQSDGADFRYQLGSVWIDPAGGVRAGGTAQLPVSDPYVPSDTVEAVILRHAPAGGSGWNVEASFPSDGTANVLALMGTSATDIWAGGVNTPRGAAAGYGGIFRYDGTSWTVPPMPDDFLLHRHVTDIAVATPDGAAALFMGGTAGTRFDGTTWTEIPELLAATHVDARGGDMYAVGQDGVIFRWTAATGWIVDRAAVEWSATLVWP